MSKPQILLVSYATLITMKGWDEFVSEYIEETADPELPSPGAQDERYLELDANGDIRVIAVVDDEELVGVAILLIAKSQHYPFPIVSTDSIYLRKPWRHGRTGIDLIGAMKALAKRIGSPGLTFMAPPDGKLDRLCKALGAKHIRNCWWLGDE